MCAYIPDSRILQSAHNTTSDPRRSPGFSPQPMPNLPTNVTPTNIARLKLSGNPKMEKARNKYKEIITNKHNIQSIQQCMYIYIYICICIYTHMYIQTINITTTTEKVWAASKQLGRSGRISASSGCNYIHMYI